MVSRKFLWLWVELMAIFASLSIAQCVMESLDGRQLKHDDLLRLDNLLEVVVGIWRGGA